MLKTHAASTWAMDGLILVRKPSLITSHDVIASLRNILSRQKIGHFGTLDPLATGLLLAAVGKATRLFPFFSKMDKVYEGRVRLGYSTDTYDAAGRPTSAEDRHFPESRLLLETLQQFVGKIIQWPPPFSAKKHMGRPLYTYARRQKPVAGRPFPVEIHSFRLTAYDPPHFDFMIKCSSGTYIRTLAHDLGQKLGCGAHLAELVRTEVGEFSLQDGLTLEEIRSFHDDGQRDRFLRPMENLLPALPKIVLNETGFRLIQNGRPVSGEHLFAEGQNVSFTVGRDPEAVVRLFDPGGKIIALARRASPPALFSPFLVLI